MKDFLHKVKCFFIAVGITVKKGFKKVTDPLHRGAGKVISPEIRPGLKNVGRMFGAVIGVFARIIMIMLLIFVLTGTIIGVFGAIYVTRYLNIDTGIYLEQFSLDLTSHMYAEDPDNPGQYIEVETLSGEQNRILARYDDIPQWILDAVVAIEDERFWQHEGVDWKRTIGAFYNLFKPDSSQFGGSTVTQQLIKNLTKEKDPTVARKLAEIFRALDFERRYDKELIMEWYLNTIYLGNGCDGIITAAAKYFGKDLDELTLAECAALVGITNNPSVYNPYSNPKNTKYRQEVILLKMLQLQLITQHEYNVAKYQPLVFTQRESTTGESVRSWYVDQAINDILDDLSRDFNWSRELARQVVFSGGVSIYLCMDVNIQKAMDDIWTNDSCWPASPDAEPAESAMMVVDHTTGEIKAMIGGREKTINLGYDLSTKAKRQPGSSIKPLTVYSPAFELGLINPYTPIDDIPVRLDATGTRGWPYNSPKGYDGRINILQGVTVSKNTVAAQIVDKVGYQRSYDFATTRFGISTLIESKTYGSEVKGDIDAAPLAFGALTEGVTVRDMTGAYSAIANRGVRNKTRTYTHIIDQNGLMYENKPDPVIAVKEKTSFYMEICLLNAVSTGTGKLAKLENMPVAGKTGTTDKNHDRWFAGYTPYYTAVCWFGYTIGRDMSYYKSNPAVHMWQQVMAKAHEGLERKEFDQPEGLETFTYCKDSGLLPCEACELDPRGSRLAVGVLDKDDIPRTQCNVHKIVNFDSASGQLATPFCPEEMLTKKALMDIVRWVPTEGFAELADEQYTLRYWMDAGQTGPENYFRPVSVGTDGKAPFNTFCELHREPLPSPSPEEPSPLPQEEPTPLPPDISPPDATEPPEELIPSPSANWWE